MVFLVAGAVSTFYSDSGFNSLVNASTIFFQLSSVTLDIEKSMTKKVNNKATRSAKITSQIEDCEEEGLEDFDAVSDIKNHSSGGAIKRL